jgi:hypothetical protein
VLTDTALLKELSTPPLFQLEEIYYQEGDLPRLKKTRQLADEKL